MLLALGLVLLLWVWLQLSSEEGFELRLKTDFKTNYAKQAFSAVRDSAKQLVNKVQLVPEKFVSYLPFRRHIRRFRRNISL